MDPSSGSGPHEELPEEPGWTPIPRKRTIRVHPPRERSCQNKKRFRSYDAARRAARSCSQRWAEAFHAYPCHFCGWWHVGHPTEENLWRGR